MDAETQVAADAQDAAEELPSDRIADLVELIVCGLVDDEDAHPVAQAHHFLAVWIVARAEGVRAQPF